MKIFCCGCQCDVEARLTNGQEIYPHRTDLWEIPIWKCDTCGNYVGCHYKTKNQTRPLGVIATKEIKDARNHIHKILDPLWKRHGMPRGRLYSMIAHKMGRKKYHTADIRTVSEAREVYKIVQGIAAEKVK